jgi:hypothetical protein
MQHHHIGTCIVHATEALQLDDDAVQQDFALVLQVLLLAREKKNHEITE